MVCGPLKSSTCAEMHTVCSVLIKVETALIRNQHVIGNNDVSLSLCGSVKCQSACADHDRSSWIRQQLPLAWGLHLRCSMSKRMHANVVHLMGPTPRRPLIWTHCCYLCNGKVRSSANPANATPTCAVHRLLHLRAIAIDWQKELPLSCFTKCRCCELL